MTASFLGGLFTFPNPIQNGIIEYSQNLKNTEIWHMDEIDPNDFEWNGRKFMLNETGEINEQGMH